MLASFAKAYVTCLLLGVSFFLLANDSETNNSVWKAMLASFVKAYVTCLLLGVSCFFLTNDSTNNSVW